MRILVDLDGVLVNTNISTAAALGMTLDEYLEKWPKGSWCVSEAFGQLAYDKWHEAASTSEEFWSEMPEYSWARRLWDACEKIAPTYILSCCVSGKMKWIYRFTGDPKFNRAILTKTKETCARWNHVLIDDKEGNIDKFIEEGGEGVLFPSNGNRLHRHSKDPCAHVLPELESIVKRIKRKEMGKTWPEIRLDCIKELGYARMYMDYLNGGIDWEPQRSEVIRLCSEMEINQNKNDLEYWMGFHARIIDEIENMC